MLVIYIKVYFKCDMLKKNCVNPRYYAYPQLVWYVKSCPEEGWQIAIDFEVLLLFWDLSSVINTPVRY